MPIVPAPPGGRVPSMPFWYPEPELLSAYLDSERHSGRCAGREAGFRESRGLIPILGFDETPEIPDHAHGFERMRLEAWCEGYVRGLAFAKAEVNLERIMQEIRKENHDAGYDLDLRWTNSNQVETGRYLEAREFGRLAELITATSDVNEMLLRVDGTLVGFNSVYATFHLVEPGGESYKGRLADGFPTHQDWTVNKRYAAVIKSEVTTRFSTDEQTSRFTLVSLEADPD